jgi:hypothetical protein
VRNADEAARETKGDTAPLVSGALARIPAQRPDLLLVVQVSRQSVVLRRRQLSAYTFRLISRFG